MQTVQLCAIPLQIHPHKFCNTILAPPFLCMHSCAFLWDFRDHALRINKPNDSEALNLSEV